MGSLVDTSGPIPVESTSSLIPPPTSDNHLLLVDEQKMFDIVKPHHQDVLCGRGVTTNRHPGNESFRSLVGLNKVRLKKKLEEIPNIPNSFDFSILHIIEFVNKMESFYDKTELFFDAVVRFR